MILVKIPPLTKRKENKMPDEMVEGIIYVFGTATIIYGLLLIAGVPFWKYLNGHPE